MAKRKKIIDSMNPTMKDMPNVAQQNIHMPMLPALPQSTGIQDQFQVLQQKNEMAEVLKELFDVEKIKLTSELSKNEIKLITRINLISELKDLPKWKEGTELYMKLMLSHKRQSRKEILSAIEGFQRRMLGMMDRIRGRFSGDR